ncbi:ABC transporter permease [Spirochaetia bacterium]|nr:ABC transporter permease [Spirochaetia bacterium]
MSLRTRLTPLTITIKTLKWLCIMLICFFSLFPVAWCLSTSFKPEAIIYRTPPEWIPRPPTLGNYAQILINKDMGRYFFNTLILSIGTAVITMFVSILAGYGFSRYRFTGSKFLIWTILFARILPRVAVIIPFYIILRNLKLINTYPGLILIYLTICLPVAVWMLKGYFDNLPIEIEEAAIIDGCSPFTMLIKIILPMSGPIVVTVAMNAFILSWNEFLFALTMTNGKAIRPIAVGLAYFIDEMGVRWGPLMAASVLMSIPAVLFFAYAQGKMVKGLSAGAVKG